MHVQRRKTITWELFQANVHSLLFFGQARQTFFFFFFLIDSIIEKGGPLSKDKILL